MTDTNTRGSKADDKLLDEQQNDNPTEDLSSAFNGSTWVCSAVNCNKSFPREKSLRNHRENLHDIGIKWPCKLCDKTFRIKNSMNAHVWRVHDGKKGSENVVKQEISTNNDALDDSVTIPTDNNEGGVNCSQCNKSFPTVKKQQAHEKYYHPQEGIIHNCNACDKTFKTLNSKNVHMYTSHTKEERNKQASKIQDDDLMSDIEEEAGLSDNNEMIDDNMVDDNMAASSITLE